MSLKKFILHRIIPLPDIDSFDSYVFVAPHPDDAEVGAGATMAKLAEQSKRITLIIATDGRYGSESADYDREALALKRREEQEASSRLLGIQETVFLPFTDGGLYDERDLVKALVGEFARLKPQAIFCPDPLLHTECHADHLKVGRAALNAARLSALIISITPSASASASLPFKKALLVNSPRSAGRAPAAQHASSTP